MLHNMNIPGALDKRRLKQSQTLPVYKWSMKQSRIKQSLIKWYRDQQSIIRHFTMKECSKLNDGEDVPSLLEVFLRIKSVKLNDGEDGPRVSERYS